MSLKDSKTLQLFNPLDSRPYRYKQAVFNFFCPLCRTERAMTANHRLTAINFAQISLITVAITAALYPWMEFRGVFSFFLIWPAFEGVRRVLFRKEVPCPHCGFDAGWYKKDVKVARQKVSEFWAQREVQESEFESQIDEPEVSDS